MGGTLAYSCIIKCTNLMFSDTVTLAIIPSDGSQPWYFKDIKFGPGTQYELSYDTVDWLWCQDDALAVLDSSGKVQDSWRFHMKEYGPANVLTVMALNGAVLATVSPFSLIVAPPTIRWRAPCARPAEAPVHAKRATFPIANAAPEVAPRV